MPIMTPRSETLIDLSHVVEHGMITYRGLPAPLICDFLSREASRSHYAEGTEFYIGKIEMVAHTGTYVDAPFHRFAHGKDVSALPLTSLAHVPGVLVHVPEGMRAVDESLLAGLDVAGKAVLIHTGWSRHWGTSQYFEGHTFVTRGAAQHLADHGAAFIGIDSYNIDDTSDGARPVHTILLGADIPICEHMTRLGDIPDHVSFRVFAVPVKVQAMGAFPVRAFALVES